ncbi:RnfABCDGE type electron transport complex subunit D [candidate division KSB1 bacterium]|nr:RnfABCDGE type electron transport complex subunit D [candidate division KSB1 bacterium]
MEKTGFLSVSPHIRDDVSIPKIMYSVVLSLLPALAGAVYFFGLRSLWLTLVSVATAVVVETLLQKLMGREITALDGSAIVTGILLAFNLPPGVPFWMPAVGSFFAIAIAKIPFGGLGYNPLNPALAGRAFLLASWPVEMTTRWIAPRGGITAVTGIDAFTGATPLGVLKESHKILADQAAYSIEKVIQARDALDQLSFSYGDLFWGRVGGCLGETSVLLLLIGAVFLMYKRYVGWKIPFSFLGMVMVLSWIFGGDKGGFSGDPIFHLLSGGLILGAFFMATDMVTTPVTFKGRLIFGTGCGVLTVAIRLLGGYPEGVSYSILLMNLTTPLIDRYTMPRIFGTKK